MNNSSQDRLKLSYADRIKYCKNKITKDLLSVMEMKKTNLCVAADLISSEQIIKLADDVGPFICCLKTHIDMVEDFNFDFIEKLKILSKKHNFIIMEDRKFSDIGNTVKSQFSKGIYKINTWAELVTVHSTFGEGVLDAINDVNSNGTGVFLLAQASSSGLIDENYTNETINLALKYENLISGIVCQNALFKHQPGMLQLTPGVQLDQKKDNLGQKFHSPKEVIFNGADIAVVGRGITQSNDVKKSAEQYKDLLWKAYLERISN